MRCPECGSDHTNKCGYRITRKGKKPRLQCQECGKTFYDVRELDEEKAP